MALKFPLYFEGSKGEKSLYTLFDSGATLSCIHPDLAADLGIMEPMHKPMLVSTASEGHRIEINSTIRLDFYIDDIRLSDEFLIVPGLSEEAIIGAATMQKWRIKLNFEADKVEVDPKAAKLILINLIHKTR